MGWLSDVYVICAVVGGTVLVVQTILLVFAGGAGDHDLGGAGDGDVDGHVGHDTGDLTYVRWLSLKTIVAALTFFGLGGLAAEKGGLSGMVGFLVALVAGFLAILAVGFLMASLARLQSSGNLDLRNAVGRAGTVYLRVPAAGSGRGKVTIDVQGRSIEVEATTAGPELPTGAMVRVVGLSAGDALDVSAP
jgi:hypothetical protein